MYMYMFMKILTVCILFHNRWAQFNMESPAKPVTPGQVDIDVLQKIYAKLSVLDTLVAKVDAILTRINKNENEIKKD